MTLNAPQNFPKRSKMRRGVADSRDGSQSQHHLLVDVENGNEQEESPHEVGAVVLSRLGVGAEGAGIVVAGHDDEARAHDGEEGLGLEREPTARRRVAVVDGAQGTVDVSDVGLVEDGGLVARRPVRAGWCEVQLH